MNLVDLGLDTLFNLDDFVHLTPSTLTRPNLTADLYGR
jgi:hypothetical protein